MKAGRAGGGAGHGVRSGVQAKGGGCRWNNPCWLRRRQAACRMQGKETGRTDRKAADNLSCWCDCVVCAVVLLRASVR